MFRRLLHHFQGEIFHSYLKKPFYAMLVVHLGIIFVNNQYDAQFFFM
jgi:hypothetical protein